MEFEETGVPNPTLSDWKQEVNHIAVDGEGSVTVIDFRCGDEHLRLQVTIAGSEVTAGWVEPPVEDLLTFKRK